VSRSQTVSFTQPSNMSIGQTQTIFANATSGLPVTVLYSPTTVCSMSGSTISALSAGTCFLTFAQGGGSGYLAAPVVSTSFTVGGVKSTQTISFRPLNSLYLGGSQNVNASSSSNLPVTFYATPSSVCYASGSSVYSVGVGTCFISFEQLGNSSFSAAPRVSTSFNVLKIKTNQVFTGSGAVYCPLGYTFISGSAASSWYEDYPYFRRYYWVTSRVAASNGFTASGYIEESYRNFTTVSYGTAGSKRFTWSPPVSITCNG
jgi:hypothetical protein